MEKEELKKGGGVQSTTKNIKWWFCIRMLPTFFGYNQSVNSINKTALQIVAKQNAFLLHEKPIDSTTYEQHRPRVVANLF